MKRPWLEPKEAAKQFAEDPTQIVWPLSYFIDRFGMSPEEVLGELRSGRLVSETTPEVLAQMKQGTVDAEKVDITAKSVFDWFAHPETPPRLIKAFMQSLKRQ